MMKVFRLAAQTALLWGIYWVCNRFVQATGLPIPGNVIGVAVLFSLLCFGVVKLEHVQEAADFLLKHLVFFFIPIAVGLMDWGPVFYDYGLVLLAAIVASSLIPFWAVGFITQRLHRKEKPCTP
ncbi:CidA/LrgA family protein [Fundidesulfovibrio putealis]|uniref:CidA/LrgA family protein n=1 Tax=Fundidesulfovibrio putealis TaxID=270496 RepID=UPI00048076CF|nr:CidA/LrgA family protein [Fundidesulfovibrio putealis]